MRIILVGQAPARSGDGRPFTGSSGKRLCKLLGIRRYDDLAEMIELTNLISTQQPKRLAGKGDVFHREIAAIRAAELKMAWLEANEPLIVLCAGDEVWKAFQVGSTPRWLEAMDWGPIRFYRFPHPSGVNRWWNDPDNEKAARIFLRRLLFA